MYGWKRKIHRQTGLHVQRTPLLARQRTLPPDSLPLQLCRTALETQREVRHIMETEYLNAPGGLSGNDDAGQMSAWYVFSAMGFYPVCPGTPYYIIGSPSFPRMSICLENGKTFTILAHNANEKNVYIQSARLNGKEYDKNYFTHQDIVQGGTLEFQMGPNPNPNWGASTLSLPPETMK